MVAEKDSPARPQGQRTQGKTIFSYSSKQETKVGNSVGRDFIMVKEETDRLS